MKSFILVVLSSFIVCSCSSSRIATNSQESSASVYSADASENVPSAQLSSGKPVGFNADKAEVIRRNTDTSSSAVREVQFDTK